MLPSFRSWACPCVTLTNLGIVICVVFVCHFQCWYCLYKNMSSYAKWRYNFQNPLFQTVQILLGLLAVVPPWCYISPKLISEERLENTCRITHRSCRSWSTPQNYGSPKGSGMSPLPRWGGNFNSFHCSVQCHNAAPKIYPRWLHALTGHS